MKETELRRTLARIQPGETLVEKTLSAMHAKRQEEYAAAQRTERRSFYGFSRRLAGALCALCLLIGLSVMLRQTPQTPDGRDGYTPGGIAPSAHTLTTDGEEQVSAMLSRARNGHGDYILVQGELAACFLSDATEDSTLFYCLMSLSPIYQIDKRLTGTAEAPAPDEEGFLQTGIYLGNAAAGTAQAAVGTQICLWLAPTPDGEWVAVEWLPLS